MPKFDYIIVDEAFWQTFVQHVDVELAELLALRNAHGDEVERALRRAIWEALTDREPALLDAVRAAWAACVDRALAEEPEEPARPLPCGPASGVAAVLERASAAKRAAAREAEREARRRRVFGSLPEGATREEALARLPEELARMATDIRDAWLKRYLGRAEPGAEGARQAAIVAGLPPRPAVERLLLELAAELVEAPTRAHSIAIVWAWRKDRDQPRREVIEVRFAPGRARLAGPTMFLDATADEDILRCFKPEIGVRPDRRRAAERRRDPGLRQPDEPHRLGGPEAPGPRPGGPRPPAQGHAAPVVFPHKHDWERKTFTLPTHARDGYLGHTRGRNDWEACDAAFIVGGFLPNLAVVERAAAVLARISGREVNLTGEWEDKLRGVRMRDGSVQRVWNRGHADPLADAVLKQMQAAELAQTAGRIRAVRATTKKHIVLLTNVVVDMDVDRLVKLDDLAAPRLSPSIAAVRARLDGFLILSARGPARPRARAVRVRAHRAPLAGRGPGSSLTGVLLELIGDLANFSPAPTARTARARATWSSWRRRTARTRAPRSRP